MSKYLFALLLLVLCGCDQPDSPMEPDAAPQRIISLAPNITDMLHDLGLADRIVGTSRFSGTDETAAYAIVGDFMNINYESVVSLKPDLVVLEQSSDAQVTRLESLGIPYLKTGSLTLAGITESIRRLGEVCRAEENANTLIDRMQRQMQADRNNPAHRPRVLLTFSGFSSPDKVEQVYAFGADCIHSELLEIAGGTNVVTDARPSVLLSREAVIRLNPELIIELTAGGTANNWLNLDSVDAVRNRRIYVFDGDYTCIPSPQCLMQTLHDFSEIIRQQDESK